MRAEGRSRPSYGPRRRFVVRPSDVKGQWIVFDREEDEIVARGFEIRQKAYDAASDFNKAEGRRGVAR